MTFTENERDKTERTISITLTFTELSEAQRAGFYEIVDFSLADLTNRRPSFDFLKLHGQGANQQHPLSGNWRPVPTADSPRSSHRISWSLCRLRFSLDLRERGGIIGPRTPKGCSCSFFGSSRAKRAVTMKQIS